MYRRSPLGILVSAIILVVAIVFGVSKAINNVDDAKKGVQQANGGGDSGADSGDSLIKASNFGKAIAAIKAKTGAGGQVLELRLEPKQAKFQVRDGGGAKGWTYSSGGDLSDFRVKLIGPGRIEDNVFPIAQLNAGTPERIVAGIHAKAPQYTLADIQFMTLDIDPVSRKPVWAVNIGQPGSGNLYQADLNGANVRKPGELPTGVGAGTGTTGAPGTTGAARAGRIADCISKAAGDPVKIQACAAQ
jgi:hypothetical protein